MKHKFRAYNKETEKTYKWSDIQRFGNLQKLFGLNHVIVMQFTGLTDKHGIEIYENDIVKVNGDEIGSITFNRGNFWVSFFQEPAQQSVSDFVEYNHKTDKFDIVNIEIVGKTAAIGG